LRVQGLTGSGRPRRGTDPRRRACGSCAAARRPPRPGAASSGIWRRARRRPRPRRSLPAPRGAPRGRLRGPPEAPRAPGRAASLWCLRSHEARRCGRRAQWAGPPKPRAKGICRLSRRMRGQERAGVLAHNEAGCACAAAMLSFSGLTVGPARHAGLLAARLIFLAHAAPRLPAEHPGLVLDWLSSETGSHVRARRCACACEGPGK